MTSLRAKRIRIKTLTVCLIVILSNVTLQKDQNKKERGYTSKLLELETRVVAARMIISLFGQFRRDTMRQVCWKRVCVKRKLGFGDSKQY